MDNYFNATGTIGFTCDNCGRELLGCTWVNGMKFCAKCYQETFGNNNMSQNLKNMYDAYSKLLEEKDKRIKELEEQLANAIVPKFKLSSMVCYISKKSGIVVTDNTIDKIKVVGTKERFFSNIKFQYKLTYNTKYFDEDELFATREEAEAKLKEIKSEN